MKEAISIYDSTSNSYVDVQWIIRVLWQEESSIVDCRKYYPWYVNGILRDRSWRTHKTPEWFNNDGLPVAFFRGRTLIAIWYVPVWE